MTPTAPIWEEFCPTWPAERAQPYREAGLWRSGTFFGMLNNLADLHGDRPAVIDRDITTSYADLRANVLRLARGLEALGLRRGDRVIVQLPNSTAFVELIFALFRLGVVPVLALPAHRDLEIGQFAAFAEAKALFIAPQNQGFDLTAMAARIAEATPCIEHILVMDETAGFAALRRDGEDSGWPSPHPEDVACFQISGGTTGVPKLIPRRHMEYLYNIRAATDASGLSDRTRYLCALPMSHNFPLACPGFLGTLLAGGCAIIAPDPSPDTCFKLIERHGVTATALVPSLVLAWLEAAKAPIGLDLLQVGGAKLNSSTARRVGPELGSRLQQVFGMAEGLICMTRLDDAEGRVLHSQGRPISDWDEVRVMRRDGTPAAIGETGELQVRGPYTICGYFNRPEVDADAFTADGFYRSGDIVSRDADGYVTVEGRDKDQINRGGEKIGVDEIEDTLLAHPAVIDAAVVAREDHAMGERACAFVIPRDPRPTTLALKRHLRDSGLATFKIPDDFFFVDEFPQTGIGKVSKRDLRRILGQQYFSKEKQA